jgi:hypothetical protein
MDRSRRMVRRSWSHRRRHRHRIRDSQILRQSKRSRRQNRTAVQASCPIERDDPCRRLCQLPRIDPKATVQSVARRQKTEVDRKMVSVFNGERVRGLWTRVFHPCVGYGFERRQGTLCGSLEGRSGPKGPYVCKHVSCLSAHCAVVSQSADCLGILHMPKNRISKNAVGPGVRASVGEAGGDFWSGGGGRGGPGCGDGTGGIL